MSSTTPMSTGGPALGTILLGLTLIAAGVGWALYSLGIISGMPWSFAVPGLLIVIGLGLLLDAPRGTHGGLITLGIILSIGLIVIPEGRMHISTGVGERLEQPQTVAALDQPYNLGMGTLTLDLENLDLPPGEHRIKARVGMGELDVRLPPETAADIHWRVGLGQSETLGESQFGAGLNGQTTSPNFATAERKLVLDVSVGTGTLEVRQ